jgi:lipoprotein-releasing system permease protein
MLFPFYIAKRYLFAKKSQNVINIITAVSIIGIAVGTAGLVIVLSVFNGFGNLVLSLYDSFDPDIKITSVAGKSFDPAKAQINNLKNIYGITSVSEIVEENVLLKYRDRQVIARIKGVDSVFIKTSSMKSKIIDGDFILQSGDTNYAVFGSGVAYYLSMDIQHIFAPVQLFVPKRGMQPSLNPEDAFNRDWIVPSGVFALQQDFDNKYVFVPITFARKLFDMPIAVSSLEISIARNEDADLIKEKILAQCGNSFVVSTRAQQHNFLYKILTSEKFVAYFILCLILLISTFNILGSLTMLIIEKKHDIGLLLSLGADLTIIKNIFLTEGLLITSIGAISGILLGLIICLLQMSFGFIAIENSESFVIDAYPVSMQLTDFILSFLIVIIIGATASYYTAQKIVKKYTLAESC